MRWEGGGEEGEGRGRGRGVTCAVVEGVELPPPPPVKLKAGREVEAGAGAGAEGKREGVVVGAVEEGVVEEEKRPTPPEAPARPCEGGEGKREACWIQSVGCEEVKVRSENG